MDPKLRYLIRQMINKNKNIHLKYKNAVQRLNSLELNLSSGRNTKRKTAFPLVVGPNGDEFMIRSMDTNTLFVHDEGDFYPSHVYEISTSKKHKLVKDTFDMFSVKSADLD